MYWDWHSTCVECLRFRKDLDLAMSVACQAHSYKWKREEFLALFARPVPESTFFFFLKLVLLVEVQKPAVF